ncbi:hypothetical protein G647_07346 [Cladophialophora carrionii CBS 160.54]|uniref:Zn(2)-C6 fungal-type domain-containing protein n=1 Tax=Cladophialophora carrionii CBS 160.54 TaxID=1279043 RepID=V9D3Z5_9EURO|nr:uncharacterized protein G647_07346 [Cladophialophora carrionii CBS 160.54]ETI21003.1 hypothetical protein G647_07346 [Cladophialophora carrionii CBS 160.54]
MARAKRNYVPKVKGCFECSQRRIDCDRTQPNCAKCVAKGINCSGLGPRYRFVDDITSSERRREARETLQSHLASPLPDEDHQSRTKDTAQFYTCAETKTDIDAFPTDHERMPTSSNTSNGRNDLDFQCTSLIQSGWAQVSWSASSSTPLRSNHEPSLIPTPPSDLIAAWQRYCLFYCKLTIVSNRLTKLIFPVSDHIAAELVVIDDHQNGWRYLILPIAHLDELVREAVLSASVFHFCANVKEKVFDPNIIYGNAIRRLRQRQNLEVYDTSGKQTVLLALLVLLATVIVNGSSDFPTVFNLLEAALTASGGEAAVEVGELGVFLVRQIRKFRGYAAPFLSQERGVTRLSLTASGGQEAADGWDCFKSYYALHPEYNQQMSLIYDLNQQACDIYVTRASMGVNGLPSSEPVAKFIRTLELLPPSSPGEHILVFAIFIVASESVLPEHQQYFTNVLLRHHQRNGFANILTALEHLKRSWSERSTIQDWTERLPQMQVFIV